MKGLSEQEKDSMQVVLEKYSQDPAAMEASAYSYSRNNSTTDDRRSSEATTTAEHEQVDDDDTESETENDDGSNNSDTETASSSSHDNASEGNNSFGYKNIDSSSDRQYQTSNFVSNNG